MSEFIEKALEKLKNQYITGKFDKYAAIMKASVKATLEDFCRQDEEFAQAVAQGGSFEECMKAVARGCGSGISDLEAYRRAVKFYFPGAEVRMQMSIDLVGTQETQAAGVSPREDSKAEKAGIILDFTDFL